VRDCGRGAPTRRSGCPPPAASPAAGRRIAVGGIDVREQPSATLLRQFSLVFQDVYPFNQNIEENIRLGRADADTADVRRAARAAGVEEIVDRLPDGWQTAVGEIGAALSGGERQRISLARALLKDAPIILLDEATSALDPQSEAAVVRGVRELTRDKTVIVVAHRLTTISHADQILFLDGGRIIERGSHDELLRSGGPTPHSGTNGPVPPDGVSRRRPLDMHDLGGGTHPARGIARHGRLPAGAVAG